jgi:hypothetical protein
MGTGRLLSTGSPTVGTGRATASVTRLPGDFPLIRKEFRAGVEDPAHWAYWRREQLAYSSRLLPDGPEFRAPKCYGISAGVVYLEDVIGRPEHPAVAARRLGAWQAHTEIPKVDWLTGHQLAQRITAKELDWRLVDADPRLAGIWARRFELLAELEGVPRVLSHGDFHRDHLIAAADTTVVLDWATLGMSPVGADLAHLALSTLEDLWEPYLAGLGGRFDAEAVRVGYQITLALTGTSRVHWMRSRGVEELPEAYEDFVLRASGNSCIPSP